jgi:hypothetical protein
MNADPSSPMANPGRRLYEQVRALRRAKRRVLRRGVTAVPTKPATVLQFPRRPTPPDQEVS